MCYKFQHMCVPFSVKASYFPSFNICCMALLLLFPLITIATLSPLAVEEQGTDFATHKICDPG